MSRADAPIVIVGLGEMGAAFAHGLLRLGRKIVPVNRGDDPRAIDVDPELVLVAVGEDDLAGALEGLPAAWRGHVGLLQNELSPADWETHGIVDPTVAIVWFEKKRSKPLNVVLPTVVAGPRAQLLADAVTALALPAEVVGRERLAYELVKKNLYILTANVAGLVTGGTVSELWRAHRALAHDVARDVLAIEAWRLGAPLPEAELVAAMVEAFEADPTHQATGRSAPARLARALARADTAGLAVPALRAIAASRGG
ncbi:MAG: hypothetical protein KF729_24985 [Sandaracinaceae bacterium]|nr:hypothetical protein [Sandaracinaceae bacterium]